MNELTKEKQKRVVRCLSCNTLVFCEGNIGNIFFIKCPNCNKRGLVFFRKANKMLEKIDIYEIEPDQKKNIKYTETSRRFFSMNQFYRIIQIVGILFIIIGIGFFIQPPALSFSFTLIFIGFLLLFMISETRRVEHTNNEPQKGYFFTIKNTGLFIHEIILFSIIIWMLFLFFITIEADFGIFFILVFLGSLAAKELTDSFTTIIFKKRMNIFLVVFLIGTVLILVQRLITL